MDYIDIIITSFGCSLVATAIFPDGGLKNLRWWMLSFGLGILFS